MRVWFGLPADADRGAVDSTIAALNNPFDAIGEFKGEYRCIGGRLAQRQVGQSSGPLRIDRPWDAYTATISA